MGRVAKWTPDEPISVAIDISDRSPLRCIGIAHGVVCGLHFLRFRSVLTMMPGSRTDFVRAQIRRTLRSATNGAAWVVREGDILHWALSVGRHRGLMRRHWQWLSVSLPALVVQRSHWIAVRLPRREPLIRSGLAGPPAMMLWDAGVRELLGVRVRSVVGSGCPPALLDQGLGSGVAPGDGWHRVRARRS